MNNVGLVLSGGGARGAYQVGALRALVEILGSQACPFNILAGLSAGAINCAALAMHAADFAQAVERLTATWLSLTPGNVYRTDVPKLTSVGARVSGVTKVSSTLGTKLLSEHRVLREEVVGDALLVGRKPSGQGQQQEVKRLASGAERSNSKRVIARASCAESIFGSPDAQARCELFLETIHGEVGPAVTWKPKAHSVAVDELGAVQGRPNLYALALEIAARRVLALDEQVLNGVILS